jgi:hypothetical protein
MRGSFGQARDFTRPDKYMSPVEVSQQYRLLDSLLRKREPNPNAYVDTMILLLQHDSHSERCTRAFERVLNMLIKQRDESTARRIENFDIFVVEGSPLDQMRVAALAKLTPATNDAEIAPKADNDN